MKNIATILDRLIHEEDGQNLIEYAIVAGAVALVAIFGMTLLQTQISAAFTAISNRIGNAASSF